MTRKTLTAVPILALFVLLALLTGRQGWAAGRPSCLVSNERTGLGLRSLQAAVDSAAPGDTLVVHGTCVGASTISKGLTLKGVSNKPFGQATLDGDRLGAVLTISGAAQVTVDALVVTGGSAGGIVNGIGSALTLRRSIVSGNASVGDGGGVVNVGDSTLTLRSSTVRDNSAGGAGGGIFSQNGSTVSLYDSTLSGNHAHFPGGGLFSFNGGGGKAALVDSTVTGNTADSNGGGIDFIFGAITLTDSTVSGNSAVGDGGGVHVTVGAFTLVGNSTVEHNSAGGQGGGIFNFGGSLTNCIPGGNVFNNTPNDIAP